MNPKQSVLSTEYMDCHFFPNLESATFRKVCINPEKYLLYKKAFSLEFQHMSSISPNEAGAHLFPKYLDIGVENGCPFLLMEYIPGKTLEEILRSKKNYACKEPRTLLSWSKISHICQQIFDALCCLSKHQILYFDLLPRNIIVLNEKTYDIKLIDFTFCHYTDLSSCVTNFGYKRMDFHIPLGEPLPLTVRRSMMLFITRLFFTGELSYANMFSTSGENAAENQRFFQRQFLRLFELLWNDEDSDSTPCQPESCDYLDILRPWYNKLNRLLEKKI